MPTTANTPDSAERFHDQTLTLERAPALTPDPSSPDPVTDVRVPPARDDAGESEGEGEQIAAPGNSMRDQIAARFRDRRAQHEGKFAPSATDDPLQNPSFLSHPTVGEDDEDALTGDQPDAVVDDAARAAPAPAQRQPAAQTGDSFRLKVRGNELTATRQQLIEMAGMDPMEAEGMPASVLIKAAQIVESSKILLTDARQFRDEARAARTSGQYPGQEQQQRNDPQVTTTAQRTDTTKVDPMKLAVEKITYGDPEEAAAILSNAVDERVGQHLSQERDQTKIANMRVDADKAIAQFSADNPDIVAHKHAGDFLLTSSVREIADDLRRLGTKEELIQPILTNPKHAYEVYNEVRKRGFNVRTPADILAAAGDRTREAFGLAKPAPQPHDAAASQGRVQVDFESRLAAKRAMPSQPTRSPIGSVAPPSQAQSVTQKRSSVVQQMRQQRGQA